MTNAVPLENPIRLTPVHSLPLETQLQIREHRNDAFVRKWMFTEHLISLAEHMAWLESLPKNPKQITFAILSNPTTLLGIVSLNNIHFSHQQCDWGFYFAPEVQARSLVLALEYAIHTFALETLSLEKINAQVIEGNHIVLKIHKRFFYQEEGFLHAQIRKEGVRKGVHLLGLTQEQWLQKKPLLEKKYAPILKNYPIQIEFAPPKETTLDKIKSARASNNINWMNILKIALEKSPATATPLVEDITRLDKEIASLAEELIAQHHGLCDSK